MNRKEHAVLLKLVRVSRTPIVSADLIGKLDSSDFKLGWQECHKRIGGLIEFMLKATPSELHQYLRSPER